MTVKGRKTATYKIIKKEYGNIYQFYCDISGALVKETIPYKRKEPEEELEAAWEFEGKDCFNQCHKCGRWVMDVMYNPDTHNCVLCWMLNIKYMDKMYKFAINGQTGKVVGEYPIDNSKKWKYFWKVAGISYAVAIAIAYMLLH